MPPRNQTPNVVSLFSGCGGLDLGFVQAGFTCKGAYDLDEAAVATHNANFGTKAQVFDLTHSIPTLSGRTDVLIAGPPCQGFSTAGQRRLDDPRNLLLTRAGEIALELKPKVILVENVAGAKAGAHRKYWESLCRLLGSAGYKMTVKQCEARQYGVPQIRKRLILVAHKTDRSFKFPCPVLEEPTLRDALAGVESVSDHAPEFVDSTTTLHKILAKIPQGKKLSNVRGGERAIHTWHIPEIFGRTNATERLVLDAVQKLRRQIRRRDTGDADPVERSVLRTYLGFPPDDVVKSLVRKGYLRSDGKVIDLTQTFNGKYRRLAWDGVALTVDTRFGDPRYFVHPDEQRGFSFREAARIQGFPDTFKFEGSKRDRYRQIGNAVPPPIAKALAFAIKEQLL